MLMFSIYAKSLIKTFTEHPTYKSTVSSSFSIKEKLQKSDLNCASPENILGIGTVRPIFAGSYSTVF